VSADRFSDCPECRELVARLSEYLDGELDPEACAGVEMHMGDCAPCRAFLESLRRTIALTRDLPDRELPEELEREIVEAYKKLREA
jgi:anti-sigma factor RsiW